MVRNWNVNRWASLIHRTVAASAACGLLLLAGYATARGESSAASRGVPADTDWTPVCPGGGGYCIGTFPHPTNPDIVWMNTDLSGMFKSTDGGTTWKMGAREIHLRTGGGHCMDGSSRDFAIDPTSPNICYYIADPVGFGVHNGGLWKSVDDGDTWSFVAGSDALIAASIVVDADGTLYCAERGSNKLHVSTDQAKTFTVKATLPFTLPASSVGSYSIRMATSKSNRLYVALPGRNAKGLYYTEDKGDHWQSVAALADCSIGSIGCSPSKPDFVVVVTADGSIYRASDGKTFEVCSAKLTMSRWYNGNTHGAGIGIGKSGRIVAWAEGMPKPITSDDNGKTFTDTIAQLPVNRDYLFYYPCPEQITGFAASPCSDRFYKGGVTPWRSLDNGATWESRSEGIEVLCLASPAVVDAGDPNRVYFLAGDVGFYYTPDLGKTWKTGDIDNTWCDAAGLAQDPSDPNVLYRVWCDKDDAQHPSFLYKSTDRGVSWKRVGSADLGVRYGEVGSLIVDPENPKHMYFCATQNSKPIPIPESLRCVQESNDAGATFHPMPGSPANLHNLMRAASGNLYAVESLWGGRIYKYTKSTGQWSVLYKSGATNVAVDAHDENIILVADFRGYKLMKSTDGGTTWTALKDWQGRDICARAVYIDPIRPNVMLASAHDLKGGAAGIVRSLDGGQTWSPFNDSHTSAYICGFVYGGVPGRVYSWMCSEGSCKVENVYAPIAR